MKHVYGRTGYADPLSELGEIDDGANARDVFPGEWLEMIVFPSDAIRWIVRDGLEIAE